MVKYLPFIVVPILLLVGLGYWRFTARQTLTTSQVASQDESTVPVEVPKTLPALSLEGRVKSLEDAVVKLEPAQSPKAASLPSDASVNSRIMVLESTMTDLKARVAVLEKGSSAQTGLSVYRAPLYIPMGGSGGPWLYADYTSLNEYQVSINPDDYSGYSSMQLEVNFRLVGIPGTGYVRLYNSTNKSTVTDISSTNTSFGITTSSVFKLPGGSKLYTLQVKSTESKDLYIQSARIKVNF